VPYARPIWIRTPKRHPGGGHSKRSTAACSGFADKVFLLTPRNVEVSAEERARLIEKGFFNQS
jgi:hypothetical protein